MNKNKEICIFIIYIPELPGTPSLPLSKPVHHPKCMNIQASCIQQEVLGIRYRIIDGLSCLIPDLRCVCNGVPCEDLYTTKG
ncbi:MAG: hypothetical protein Q8904_09800 [Bacteroidota bacterium]|nr:hypothetical protein [Bacteroidota bacterium]